MSCKISPTQWAQFMEHGYFVMESLLPHQDVEKIKNRISKIFEHQDDDVELDERRGGSGNELKGEERYRKILNAANDSFLWENYYTHKNVATIQKSFLGHNIRQWSSGVFTKSPRVGEATPWHQDIGIWANLDPEILDLDGKIAFVRDALSIWMAITPATKENGCLQVVPGSHYTEPQKHKLYPGAVHEELPREMLKGAKKVHIELAPGDAMVWHAHLWHYSPPNNSNNKRWGILSLALRDADARVVSPDAPWIVKDGRVITKL